MYLLQLTILNNEKIVSLQGLIGWYKLPKSGESCTKLVGQFLKD